MFFLVKRASKIKPKNFERTRLMGLEFKCRNGGQVNFFIVKIVKEDLREFNFKSKLFNQIEYLFMAIWRILTAVERLFEIEKKGYIISIKQWMYILVVGGSDKRIEKGNSRCYIKAIWIGITYSMFYLKENHKSN